jgi:hypothetical protein
LGWAEIRHPFHPLRGQRFEVLKKRRVAGVDTLILRECTYGSFSIAREWTDWADPSADESLSSPPRMLELCALTDTLVIDEDGCYNPADFNDGLLLGLKGTMAQAELHLLRGRLVGGKLNKAKKGELRFPLPVGLCYDEENRIIFDPDEEVQGAVVLVFRLFRETGSAYAVVQKFAKAGLRFPRRSYGGLEWQADMGLPHTRTGAVPSQEPILCWDVRL